MRETKITVFKVDSSEIDWRATAIALDRELAKQQAISAAEIAALKQRLIRKRSPGRAEAKSRAARLKIEWVSRRHYDFAYVEQTGELLGYVVQIDDDDDAAHGSWYFGSDGNPIVPETTTFPSREQAIANVERAARRIRAAAVSLDTTAHRSISGVPCERKGWHCEIHETSRYGDVCVHLKLGK